MSKKVLTFSNNKGETVSYVPDFEKEKSFSIHFNNILTEVKNKFGIKDIKTIKFTYNPFNDTNSINASKIIGSNILTKDNIKEFWDLLESHSRISVMNFIIGDIIGRKATIICPDSKKELIKLKTYQSYWSDGNKLDMSINNCDLEMDFICTNLNNIRECVKILQEKCKIQLGEEDMISKEDNIGMEKRFDHLLESLKIESLSTTHIYDEIVQAKEVALKHDWSKAFLIVRNALYSLRPFDIKKMLKLYDQSAAAAKQIEGKDICLLLGHTGLSLLYLHSHFLFMQYFVCFWFLLFTFFGLWGCFV